MNKKHLEEFCRRYCTRKLGWNEDKRIECRKSLSCPEFNRFKNALVQIPKFPNSFLKINNILK